MAVSLGLTQLKPRTEYLEAKKRRRKYRLYTYVGMPLALVAIGTFTAFFGWLGLIFGFALALYFLVGSVKCNFDVPQIPPFTMAYEEQLALFPDYLKCQKCSASVINRWTGFFTDICPNCGNDNRLDLHDT